MKKSDLAEGLRERQRKIKLVPKYVIDSTLDDDIIDSYITCSCCGKKLVNSNVLEASIDAAKDVDHFFHILDEVVKMNEHKELIERAKKRPKCLQNKYFVTKGVNYALVPMPEDFDEWVELKLADFSNREDMIDFFDDFPESSFAIISITTKELLKWHKLFEKKFGECDIFGKDKDSAVNRAYLASFIGIIMRGGKF